MWAVRARAEGGPLMAGLRVLGAPVMACFTHNGTHTIGVGLAPPLPLGQGGTGMGGGGGGDGGLGAGEGGGGDGVKGKHQPGNKSLLCCRVLMRLL